MKAKSDHNNDKSNAQKEHWLINMLYCVAALIIPNILLIITYNRNRVGNLLIFEHILILAGVLAVTGFLLFILFRWLIGSMEGALLVLGGFWLCFWLFERVLAILKGFIPVMSDVLLMVLLGAVIAAAAICFRRFKPPFYAIRPAFNMLALCLVGMFAFNLAPAVNHEMRLHKARSEVSNPEDNAKPYQIKREFTVDPLLHRPDIYWLHADGMMGIETMEWFGGEDLHWFKDEIDGRGFVRYENALINAGFTYASLTAMLSPEFYDSYFGELLDRLEGELKKEKGQGLYDEMTEAGLTFHEDIAPYYEVFSAFEAVGYDISVYNLGTHIPYPRHMPAVNNFAGYIRELKYNFTNSDLPLLLSMTTPLAFRDGQITADDSRDELLSQITAEKNAPSFIFYGLEETHMSNVWRYDSSVTGTDFTTVHVYNLAYYDIAETILHLVDNILAKNPNAVIVIQSDHGFHIETTQDYLLNMGYSKEQVLELMYSVFSAVYIPPQYGGLNEPLAPLNISRELVNRFVGENYELLPNK